MLERLHSNQLIKQHKGLIPITRVAELSSMGLRKLERLYHIRMGMRPSEYAKIVRIEQAREKLKINSVTYNDIVYELGFHDQAHFIHSFKSVVGITPGEYRVRKNSIQ